MKEHPCHHTNLNALKRVEGQIRGIMRMIEERKYCVDILTQIHAAMAALARVEDKILGSHFESCVKDAMNGKSTKDKKEKLDEILTLIHRSRKI